MNEWYAKDMNRKLRSALRTKSKQGYAIGFPPLGYKFDTLYERLYEDICCKGRKSNPSNTVKATGSFVAV